jgi:hypothetical protein
VRRLKNLNHALAEISRRVVGIDGFPYEAFAQPRDYFRWDPNILDSYPDLPIKTLQGSLADALMYQHDCTQGFRLKPRLIERGTVQNMIIERAISRKLNLSLDQDFSENSWGFRPGRSPEKAILEVRGHIRAGAHWAFKTDIDHFFQSISRTILLEKLQTWIEDPDLRELIATVISPGVVLGGITHNRNSGLPQGNGVSPFLGNIYLHDFDRAFSSFIFFATPMTCWSWVARARRSCTPKLS